VIFGHEGNEWVFAAHLADIEISLPSELMVFPIEVEELEGHDLGKGIVDVIERRGEDMALGQPTMAFGAVFAVLIGGNDIWGVLLFEFDPFGVSFRWSGLWMLIDPVLELVDGDAIREEGDAGGQVAITILGRILEEEVHPWLGDEFHGHGMDFA
jgi:hypothetical protein